MICYMNNYLIQYGGWGVHDLITMHAPIFAMYVGPMKVKEIKLKYFESFQMGVTNQSNAVTSK